MFLQAAGSDFGKAHHLVQAVTEAIRAPQGKPGVERIAEGIERAGWRSPESLLLAIAVHVTIISGTEELDLKGIAAAAARIGDEDLLLDAAGVVFAFNTINRIADARRVKLEFRFLRELRPIQGWVERRMVSLVGLAYDLSYRHQPRSSPEEMLERVGVHFGRFGAPEVPGVFHWLSRAPVVLEGVLEMLETILTHAGVRFDVLQEAAAIAVASRAVPDSALRRAVVRPDGEGSDLASACQRYAAQVANAAHTISEEQIGKLSGLGLTDAELLDLDVTTAVFSALAIIEKIGVAVGRVPPGLEGA